MLNFRQKLLGTLTAVSVAVGVFGWLYISMASAVGRADSSLALVREKVADLERERHLARNFERILGERKEELARIETFFVDHEHPLEFIERLENLAKITGNSPALGVEGSPAERSQLTFRITLDGNETSITQYLKLFELLPYQIGVEEFTMQKIGGSGTTGTAPTGGREPDTRLTMIIVVKTR